MITVEWTQSGDIAVVQDGQVLLRCTFHQDAAQLPAIERLRLLRLVGEPSTFFRLLAEQQDTDSTQPQLGR